MDNDPDYSLILKLHIDSIMPSYAKEDCKAEIEKIMCNLPASIKLVLDHLSDKTDEIKESTAFLNKLLLQLVDIVYFPSISTQLVSILHFYERFMDKFQENQRTTFISTFNHKKYNVLKTDMVFDYFYTKLIKKYTILKLEMIIRISTTSSKKQWIKILDIEYWDASAVMHTLQHFKSDFKDEMKSIVEHQPRNKDIIEFILNDIAIKEDNHVTTAYQWEDISLNKIFY